MPPKTINLLQNIYVEHLKLINGVKLTRREVDIIAFFICGRSAKKIASFFSISPKTVENHTHNIMLKLGCHSRESIIDFIERSDKLPILREYYTTILAEAAFNQCLKNLAHLIRKENLSCCITYNSEKHTPDLLIHHLEASLKLSGIKVLEVIPYPPHSLQKVSKDYHVIYIFPNEEEITSQEMDGVTFWVKNNNQVLFLLFEENTFEDVLKGVHDTQLLIFKDQESYYFVIFSILKRLFPTLDFESIVSDFTKQYECIEGTSDLKELPLSADALEVETKEESLTRHVMRRILNKRKPLFISLMTMVMLSGYFFFLRGNQSQFKAQLENEGEKTLPSIRSELIVPTNSVLLNRPDLMAQIDELFKGWSGIQTIALIGVGGAGKTTLAHYYAHSQNLPIIWVINAETKETLNESFEDLAHALAKKEEDQKILRGLLKVKIAAEREERTLQFVKERLKLHSNWLLIYDNVVKFTDIQKHFPRDSGKWGHGRVILTTQDSNIESNKHVNNAIQIGILNPEQKLSLFIKIMNNGGALSFTPEQIEDSKKFLAELPSFPLDVSVAAYYLKATNITYKKYIENMVNYNKHFSNIQKEILKETGDYTKTRYGIITLSLKHLIDKNKNFRDFLLFISLLDSQNIPRELLAKCSDDMVVDSFIYHLKKYSLITNEISPADHLDSIFSIHRSTQAITLAYLKQTLKLEENRDLIENFAHTLENYMSDILEKEDFSKMKILYRHVEQFLTHSDMFADELKGSLEGELGCFFYYLCNSIKSKKLLEDGLSKLQKAPEENHNKIAHFLVYLGNVNRSLGEYETAKKLFENSLEIYNKHADNDVGIARASGYLGVVYRTLGDFDKAKMLLERSVAIYNSYPDKHIGLAWSLAHLGNIYASLGDYEKAKDLFGRSRLLYKKYSENHVGAAWVSGDLGNAYLKLGDFQKAEEFMEECLKICRKHFFEDHVYIAEALVHLGILYKEKKDYERAKSLFKKSLVAFEATYGKDHTKTGAVLKYLGQTYLLEGNFQTANEIMDRTLKIFQKNKHPDQYIILESLAELYLQKSIKAAQWGNRQQAQQFKTLAIHYLNQAFESIKAYFPEDSPHLKRVQSKLTEIEGIVVTKLNVKFKKLVVKT